MQVDELEIKGCFRIRSKTFVDGRGTFNKVFQLSRFGAMADSLKFTELYFSSSKKGVIRGMHFQAPPHDHYKLVSCISGRTCDVILDLRPSSPTYRKSLALTLEGDDVAVLIGKGCAHGFQALSEQTTLFYCVTSEYSPSHDSGILWNSFGFRWPVENPVLSDRDRSFAPLADFRSPFA